MADADRWKRLATLALRRDLWSIWDLRSCADCPHAEGYPDGPECLRPRKTAHAFATCPIRELRQDRHFTRALAIYGQSKIAPLSDWPNGWAPWLTEALAAIGLVVAETSAPKKAEGG